MKFVRYVLGSLIVLALLPAGISWPAEEETVVDRMVAIVNDDIITLSEVNQVLAPYREKIHAHGYSPEAEKELVFKAREEIVNQLVEKKLADQEIKKAGIVVTESEVDKALERIKQRNYWTDEELRANLARDDLTIEQYRKKMKKQIQRARLLEYKIKSKIVVTNEDVQAYYAQHPEKFGGTVKYHLRNIIMKTSEFGKTDDENSARPRMQGIHDRLEKGESFETLARLYSDSSLADSGGDLGLFELKDLSEQIRKHVQDLKPGGFTGVIQTDAGYQIFYVEEIVKVPGKTLEKATPEIEDELYNSMLNKALKLWIDDLKKESHIKIIL